MFRFFSKQKIIECPLDEHTRLWMEYAFLSLASQFGEDRVKQKQVMLPNTTFFPYRFDGSANSLFKTAAIVARQMGVNMDEINLQVFNDTIHSVGPEYTKMSKEKGGSLTAGLFIEKDETGRYGIFIEQSNLGLPENLVALLARSLARVILQKDVRTGKNRNILTDLTAVLFGFGIFNANSSLRIFKNFHSSGYKSTGYLTQPQWGYVLALHAYYRGEENPEWISHLTPNVKADFKRSEKYITANTDKVFLQPYHEPDTSAEDALYSGRWYGYYQYGKGYPRQYWQKHVPFVIDMEVTGGLVAGTCTDENLETVFKEPAFIEGSIEKEKISFVKTYPASWNTTDNNDIIVQEGKPSHQIHYSGYFKNSEFMGTWQITSVQLDKDGVPFDYILSGTWGMKREIFSIA